jgi:hypothetical protein
VQRFIGTHDYDAVYFSILTSDTDPAAPKVFVAASSRLTNLTPVISRPQLLWTPDTIAVKVEGGRR